MTAILVTWPLLLVLLAFVLAFLFGKPDTPDRKSSKQDKDPRKPTRDPSRRTRIDP